MQKNFFIKGILRRWWPAIFFIIAVLEANSLPATVIGTFDTDGMPYYLGDEVKKDPDKIMADLKTSLIYGNLAKVGVLAEALLKTRPDDPDLRALYSIFLSSKGDISKAKQELLRATLHNKKNQYSLYAKAMILRYDRQYDNAINVCKQAISLDESHPYPWNIMGRIYFDREEYQSALAGFQRTIELEPNFLPAYSNLGAVFFLLGNHAQSIDYFQRAIRLNPFVLSAHYGLATVYEVLGRNLLAIKELEIILGLKPNNPSARQKLGELQLKAGKYQDALATGQEMLKRKMIKSHEILGHAALNMGNVKEAIDYLGKAPAESPAIDYLLGYCFMAEGNYEKALVYMERVLEQDKTHFGAHLAQITLRFYLGNTVTLDQDSENEWDKSLNKLLNFIAGSIFAAERNWEDAHTRWQAAEGLVRGFSLHGIDKNSLSRVLNKDELKYLNLGVLFYYKNLNDNALSQFGKALSINRDSPLSNYWAAQVYLKKGDRVKAAEFLENALKKSPGFFSALNTMGEINFLMGEPKRAVPYYTRALTVKKDAGILIKLGAIFENLKEYKKAEKYYQEAIRFYPDLFAAYNQLAWLYAKRGIELNKAMLLAKKADELQPGNSSINDTIGWIYYHERNYHKALEFATKANKIRPKNSTILYHLGAVYQALGNKSSAKENLENALKLSKDFEGIDEARKLLKK